MHVGSNSGGRKQQFTVKRHRDEEENAGRDFTGLDRSSTTGVKRQRREGLAPVGNQYEFGDGGWKHAVDLRGGEPNAFYLNARGWTRSRKLLRASVERVSDE